MHEEVVGQDDGSEFVAGSPHGNRKFRADCRRARIARVAVGVRLPPQWENGLGWFTHVRRALNDEPTHYRFMHL